MFDERTRTLLYVSRSGALVRTDGQRTHTLLPNGLRRWVDIRPLEEGRIGVVGRRLLVLAQDGSVWLPTGGSTTSLRSRPGAIALIATGPLDGRSRANEMVRLLRPGQQSSTLLHETKVGALGCGHWPTLAWRGSELLYATSEGHVVVMKPSSDEKLDLTAVVKRLPGEFLEARWA